MAEPVLLDLRNVTVMRGQKVVLQNFSLRIRGDERVQFLAEWLRQIHSDQDDYPRMLPGGAGRAVQ